MFFVRTGKFSKILVLWTSTNFYECMALHADYRNNIILFTHFDSSQTYSCASDKQHCFWFSATAIFIYYIFNNFQEFRNFTHCTRPKWPETAYATATGLRFYSDDCTVSGTLRNPALNSAVKSQMTIVISNSSTASSVI